MKKLFSISLFFSMTAMLFTGCVTEEDDLFSSSAAERLMASKKAYTERLGGTTWVMEFYPLDTDEAPEGSGYLILNQFKKDGSVVQAMKNELSNGKYLTDTSLWEVISDQGTVLSFNTYNKCLHTFSDPGLYQTGRGYEGDYEFVILSLDEGAKYGMLKGKKRSTYNRLTRLPDDTNFEEYLQDVQGFQNTVFPSSAPNDCLLRVGDSTMVVTNASSGIASMYPLGGDPVSQTTDHAFLITKNDGKYYFRFREALAFGDLKVQELVYDEEKDVFVSSGEKTSSIEGWPMAKFFLEYPAMPSSYTLSYEGTMSEKMKIAMSALNSEISQLTDPLDRRKRKYAFKGISFSNKAGQPVWNIVIKMPSASSNSSISFSYNTQPVEDVITFSYDKPYDETAENMKNTCLSVVDMLQVLSQDFAVTAVNTKFNLKKLRLTSTKDSELWFEVTL